MASSRVMAEALPTKKSLHGHDVLYLLLEAEGPLSPEAMLERVTARFGPDARYHTCSAEGMDARTLLAFLMERGKIVPAPGGGYVVAGHRICKHHE
jgi:probable metal-binding protein